MVVVGKGSVVGGSVVARDTGGSDVVVGGGSVVGGLVVAGDAGGSVVVVGGGSVVGGPVVAGDAGGSVVVVGSGSVVGTADSGGGLIVDPQAEARTTAMAPIKTSKNLSPAAMTLHPRCTATSTSARPSQRYHAHWRY